MLSKGDTDTFYCAIVEILDTIIAPSLDFSSTLIAKHNLSLSIPPKNILPCSALVKCTSSSPQKYSTSTRSSASAMLPL